MPLSNVPALNYTTAALATTAGLIGTAYYSYRLYQEKNKLPKEWKHVGHLKRLYVYPIKSCAPVILNQVECTPLGMRDGWLRDRILMIVDAKDNNFVTAREYPGLVRIQPSMERAILTLSYPGMDSIDINLAEVMVTQMPIQASVWGAKVPVYDCGEEASQWCSNFLYRPDKTFRLVYYASTKCRPLVGISKVFYKCRKSDTGALPDQTSYNLINEASIEDLNTRLKGLKVDDNYFRPNFVLSGGNPYDEDNWKYVRIGENIFEVVKQCSRCLMITIDPETGIPDKNREPLETLRSYRLAKDPKIRKATGLHPAMGVQVALRSGPGGVVSLDDPIYVAY